MPIALKDGIVIHVHVMYLQLALLIRLIVRITWLIPLTICLELNVELHSMVIGIIQAQLKEVSALG